MVAKIQGVDLDTVSGAMESCGELESLRCDVDSFSKRIFDHSVRIAEVTGVSVSMLCVSMHQKLRANPENICGRLLQIILSLFLSLTTQSVVFPPDLHSY